MCGILGIIGKVEEELQNRLVKESMIRGLHHLGFAHQGKKAVIWHARYCTSGERHQPIMHDNETTWLVMNGVLHMGTKKEMEAEYGIKMRTDNDAEVLLQYLDSYSPDDLFTMWPKASIAALVLTPKKLIAFRNSKRPLWVIEKGKTVLVASTLDILRRAGADWKRAKSLTPNKVYSWTI